MWLGCLLLVLCAGVTLVGGLRPDKPTPTFLGRLAVLGPGLHGVWQLGRVSCNMGWRGPGCEISHRQGRHAPSPVHQSIFRRTCWLRSRVEDACARGRLAVLCPLLAMQTLMSLRSCQQLPRKKASRARWWRELAEYEGEDRDMSGQGRR